MSRSNEFTEVLVDWVDGRLRQNRFSNMWLGGGAGADGGSSYRPIDGQLTQRHVCYDTSETASPCSPSGFSSLVDNLRRIRYWQEPATWFGVTTSGAPPSGSSLNVYIKPGLWYPSTTEYCAFAGGDSPTFTLPGVLDRVDTVYVDASGILHIQRGTPAVSPTITLPPIASGIPLWAIHLTPTSSGITHVECSGYYAGMGYIERDLRPFLNLGGGGVSASGLPGSTWGAILRGVAAGWEAYPIGAANEVLTNDGTDVMWSSKTLIIEENSILNQDLTTDASVTFADVFVPDGGTFGISGNELLTVNAAGNFTFSGVTSIIVPDGAWVGAGVHCAWLFDSSNGNITTRALWIKVGIGTVAPNELLHIKSTTGHAKIEIESTTDNATIFINAPADEFAYVSFETLGAEDWEIVRPANQTYLEIKSSAINLVMVFAKATGNVGIGIIPNQKLTVEGTIDLKEQAAANADTVAYGQIWVKNTAPNELWFTDDAGTDVQLGVGGGLPVVAGAGYALISDGVNSWVADQTPAWTGEHSFAAGIAFTGASGTNEITVPDNTAIALELLDAGGLEYMRVISTNTQPTTVFNFGEVDVDFRVAALGITDALFVQGSTGFVAVGRNAPVGHLDVYNTTVNTTVSYYGICNEHVKTAGATDFADLLEGVRNYIELDQNGAVIGYFTGMCNRTILTSGSVGDGVARDMRGIYNYLWMEDATCAVTGDVLGVYTYIDLNGGTIGNDIVGHYIYMHPRAGLTSIGGDVFGIKLYLDADQDPVGTVYSVYWEEGTNVDYGIYQNGTAPNRFGGHVDPANASGQDLGDTTHRWDLYTQDVIFGGATGANVITVPDNIADALGLLDVGGLEYMRVVSTDANPYFLIDPAAAGIKVGIKTLVPGQALQIGDVGAAGTQYIRVYNSTYGWDFGVQVGGNFRINRIAAVSTELEIDDATGLVTVTHGLTSNAKITIDNNADAVFTALDIDAGVSAVQQREIRFLDQGVAEWNIQVTAANKFNIREAGVGNWLTIIPGGNVGIGMLAPLNSLQIAAAGAIAPMLGFQDANCYVNFNLYFSAGWKHISANEAGQFQFSSAGDYYYNSAPTAAAGAAAALTQRFVIMNVGNIGIGTAVFGTNAVTVLGIGNGTAPTTSPVNMIQIFSVDTSDTKASLGLRTEQAIEVGAPTMSHKLKMLINGTEYWIGLDAV